MTTSSPLPPFTHGLRRGLFWLRSAARAAPVGIQVHHTALTFLIPRSFAFSCHSEVASAADGLSDEFCDACALPRVGMVWPSSLRTPASARTDLARMRGSPGIDGATYPLH